MGAIYTRTSQGQALRPDPLLDERYRLIETYYRPHHRRLTSAVSNALAAYGTCLIIDAHSFPSTPLPCDLDQNPIRPDFCVGTDAFHTPDRVAGQSHDYFASHGFSVGIDRPYCGSIVPLPYYRKDERVRSVMLEVNRRLYMDETTGQRSEPFEEVRRLIEGWMLQIGDTARHASGRQPNGKVAGP